MSPESHRALCLATGAGHGACRLTRYFRSSISWYLDWQLSIYWDVTCPLITVQESWGPDVLLHPHVCHDTLQVSPDPVSWAQSPSLIAQAYQSSPPWRGELRRCLPKFPPVLPTHLSPHWHHFSPASPPGHWVWVTLNSRPIFTHRLSPSSLLSG